VAHVVLADLPRNLYWFGPIDPAILLLVLKACPAVEVYFVNPWPDGVSDQLAVNPGELSRFIEVRCRFQGWARIVQGDPSTALERIDASRIGDSPIELAWIGAGTPPEVVRRVALRLAPGGVMLGSIEESGTLTLDRLRDLTPGCLTQPLGSSGLASSTRPV